MRAVGKIFRAVLALLLGAAGLVGAQEVVDRIAARVESDVILLSEVQELGRYQLLEEAVVVRIERLCRRRSLIGSGHAERTHSMMM